MNRSLKRKVLLLLFFVTAIKRKYLKKKKKYDTLNCFLSDIKWIEEMINQSSPVKKRLQDEGSFTAQHDSPPPTTLPGATPPAAPPSITQPDLSQTTTGPVLLPPTAQPDLTPPTIQPVLPQPTTRPDLPSPSTQQVLPQPTTQQVLPPPTTQPDSPPPSTHPYSPPPSTQPDSSLPSTQHDSPPPSTQPDSPPPSTQPDSPPPSTQPDSSLPSTQPDSPPPSTQHDSPPPSTQPDSPPPSTQPDSSLSSTQPDSPPPSTQPDSPPPSTQPDSPPPIMTRPDSPPPSTQPDSPLPSTQPDSPPPSTQPDSTANAISEDNLEKPSNARKLGFDIKKLINGKIGISIMTNDEPSRKEAEDLLKTMEIFWGTRVAKLSNVILEQRKYEKHKQLPNPDDIEELNKSLECSLKGLDLTTTTLENFTNVVEVVEAKLVIYNRRRVGELEAIRLADYENRKKGEAPHHLVGQLSEFERKLLTEQEVMTVRGKTGRGVPVILPAITKAPLSYLTDSSVRSACGISSKNVYVFAGKGEGVIRAYNSVLKACSRAPLKSPQLITSTNLRKYMATVTQVFDLKPNEMNWVLDHLGHSMDVHKIHYRASSEILEKTQIAKLLLLQDSNQIGKYKNMSLKDIQIEDLVMDDQVQSPVTEDFDKQVFEESQMDSDCEEIKDKRKPAVSIKVKWTPEEDEEIKQLFKKCILKKKRPSPKDCQKALERSKLNGGVLWKRKKDVLKKKMFRLIDKLNKN
ncbi:formin-2-like isoform X1 [Patella vulgata]|uniref:formin-2-like isoform X1 n=1 Tax=Patella vulgata TaxID=6465 RepID=UPI0024A7DB8C|nr:formin-2-like isoform X1 [Patella vulgata]